jgi:hypothetical protein
MLEPKKFLKAYKKFLVKEKIFAYQSPIGTDGRSELISLVLLRRLLKANDSRTFAKKLR